MKKSKIGIIILIIVIVVSVGTFFGVSYYLDKDLEKQEQELQNTKEEYGTVNEENVATLVAKFNTEVMDNGPQYPASDDYSVAENGVYWYALYEDINLYIEPLNYTGDKEADIVDITAIHFPKDSEHANIALELAKNKFMFCTFSSYLLYGTAYISFSKCTSSLFLNLYLFSNCTGSSMFIFSSFAISYILFKVTLLL